MTWLPHLVVLIVIGNISYTLICKQTFEVGRFRVLPECWVLYTGAGLLLNLGTNQSSLLLFLHNLSSALTLKEYCSELNWVLPCLRTKLNLPEEAIMIAKHVSGDAFIHSRLAWMVFYQSKAVILCLESGPAQRQCNRCHNTRRWLWGGYHVFKYIMDLKAPAAPFLALSNLQATTKMPRQHGGSFDST